MTKSGTARWVVSQKCMEIICLTPVETETLGEGSTNVIRPYGRIECSENPNHHSSFSGTMVCQRCVKKGVSKLEIRLGKSFEINDWLKTKKSYHI